MVIANDITDERSARVGEATARLRAAGRRVGPTRMAVLQALIGSDAHPGAEEIFAEARKARPSLSRGAVYRALDALRETGGALELGFHDGALSANRYDGLRPYPHPHFVCLACSAIHDVAAGGAGERIAEEAERAGFRVERYRMDLYGKCPACQPRETEPERRRNP